MGLWFNLPIDSCSSQERFGIFFTPPSSITQSRFHSCNLPVNSFSGPEHIIVTFFCIHRVVTGSLVSTATTSFIVAHAFHTAYFEPRESPFPFCSSGIPFLTSYLFLATSFSFSRVVSRKMAASHSVSATSSGRVSAPVGIPMYILVPEAEGHVPNGGKR